MFLGILISGFFILTLILCACMKVSSECSRLEEKEQIKMLYNKQLFDDATKDSYTYESLRYSEIS